MSREHQKRIKDDDDDDSEQVKRTLLNGHTHNQMKLFHFNKFAFKSFRGKT